MVSRTVLVLTAFTSILSAPIPVQEERQVPNEVITVLGKRVGEQDLYIMFGNLRFDENGLAAVHLQEPAPPLNMPPPNAAGAHVQDVPVPPQNAAEAHVQEVPVPLQNAAEVHVPQLYAPQPIPILPPMHLLHLLVPPGLLADHVPEVHMPPHGPADSDRESMVFGDDAPRPSPVWSTDSEGWVTEPTSPGSDTNSDRWSTNSNAPSVGSQAENLKAADGFDWKGKAKVSRRISDTASDVDMDAAQMELRSTGDPGP